MKICIPTESNSGKEAMVYGHFGSAPFFTIYDTTNNTVEIIVNENQHHVHGMCQPMAALGGKGVNAVLTGGAGAGAIQKLNQGGIRVYRAIAGTVADVATLFAKGDLEEMSVQNSCTHHDCH
jgi:predicted Fe-Mo cluster-binding NifX family protein